MKIHRSDLIDKLEISVGETVDLESLRESVVPPYLMLMPFIESPDEIAVEGQDNLDEDGVHGCIYHLKAEKACKVKIVVGFRDIQTNKITHRKSISIIAR